jgi:selenocysteine-specific elongation factor
MKSNRTSIFNVVIGTAGHIDHGKSTLVEKLTGINPDRLPEEQARGMTIDLGFAPLTLRNGLRVGIVDVPGHERLVKNMVAGATGVDIILFVVAADDGIMPQTREHLTILQILGHQHGIVVVTKIDAVESDLRELVKEELKETLKGTFLEHAPVAEVSSVTGEGYPALLDTIHAEIEKVQPRQETGVFRMPIQRVFSTKGFGTIVTGIPVAGSVRIGDVLEIAPLGKTGRVRGIQAYKEATDMARAGHSTALNVTDVDYHEVHRGMVATEPGYFHAAEMFEATLLYLPGNRRPLLHQTAVRLHVGTAEVLGRVHLLEAKRLEPGEESYVQFRLEEPVVAAPGDRYVLRLHSPMETIGGGELIDRSRWRLKSGKSHVVEGLREKEAALGDRKRFLLQAVVSEGYSAVPEKDLPLRCGLPPEEARELLSELVAEGKLARASRAGSVYATQVLEQAVAEARRHAASYYASHPHRLLMEKAGLRQALRCQEVFFQDLVSALEARGEATSERAGQMRWRDFGPRLSADAEEKRQAIASVCRERKFTPPAPAELAEERGWDAETTETLYQLLEEGGELQKLAEGIYLHREAMEDARSRIRQHLEQKGSMTASDAKNLLGSTRKYSIPLLEQLDREGLTVRRGDLRELRKA